MLYRNEDRDNSTLLFYNNPKAKEIDMEIGDLKNEYLTPQPLLTCYRYNQIKGKEELNNPAIKTFKNKEVEF